MEDKTKYTDADGSPIMLTVRLEDYAQLVRDNGYKESQISKMFVETANAKNEADRLAKEVERLLAQVAKMEQEDEDRCLNCQWFNSDKESEYWGCNKFHREVGDE